MRNNRFIFGILLACLFSCALYAQESKESDELEILGVHIENYMYNHDTLTYDRKSEFIMLFLQVDSIGRIMEINIMSDKTNEGPTYMALRNITPDALKEWKSKKYFKKLIVLPVLSEGSVESGYLDYLEVAPVYTQEQCKIKGL